MKDVKMLYAILALAVVVLGASVLYWYVQKQGGYISQYYPENEAMTAPTNTAANNTPANGQNNAVVTAELLSYADAVKKYDKSRLQFTLDVYGACRVSPYSATLKKGSGVMLDNRTDTQLNVYLDNQLYSIKPYGFKVAVLGASATLPHTVKIDCGGGKNNASIMLQ